MVIRLAQDMADRVRDHRLEGTTMKVQMSQTWIAGDWFISPSGKRLHVLEPRPEQIDIEDIASSLSKICRFGGMTRSFYSVAEHSVMVSHLVPPELALVGLLHDATEAYLGDVIRPLKQQLYEYRRIEGLWAEAIGERFGVEPEKLPPGVKQADGIAVVTERRDLMHPNAMEGWVEDEQGFQPLPGRLMGVNSPWSAEMEFLSRCEDLT